MHARSQATSSSKRTSSGLASKPIRARASIRVATGSGAPDASVHFKARRSAIKFKPADAPMSTSASGRREPSHRDEHPRIRWAVVTHEHDLFLQILREAADAAAGSIFIAHVTRVD